MSVIIRSRLLGNNVVMFDHIHVECRENYELNKTKHKVGAMTDIYLAFCTCFGGKIIKHNTWSYYSDILKCLIMIMSALKYVYTTKGLTFNKCNNYGCPSYPLILDHKSEFIRDSSSCYSASKKNIILHFCRPLINRWHGIIGVLFNKSRTII